MKKLLLSLAALCMAATMNAQFSFQEDFTTNTNLTGWTIYEDNLANGGNYSSFPNGWFVTNYTSEFGNAAVSISWTNPDGACDRWLITPAITLPSDGNNALMFDDWGYDNSYPEVLEIMISTTGTAKSDFTSIKAAWNLPSGMTSEMVDLSAYAGQQVYIAFVNKGDGYYVGIDNIKVGVPPSDEVEATAAHISAYTPQNTVAQVTVTVTNKGMNNLTSFEAYYTVNGGAPIATETVSGINVAYNGTYTYTFNTPFMESAEGNYTIDVTVANPNGEADDASDNIASTSTIVYDESKAVERTVLIEHFTTGKCPNCPSAETRMETALAGKTNYIWLKHHDGYYTDEMSCPEDHTLLAFYNAGGSTYAPAAMFDRSVEFGDGVSTPLDVPQQPNVIEGLLAAAQGVPAFSTVALSNINFDPATRKLSCTVSGTASNLENPVLALYLMEDSLLYAQSGASGKIHHMHVMRHAISDVWGDAIQNGSYNKNYEYTVPETFKVHKCKLIAFVANNSANILNRRVANATQSAFINAPYVGIDEVADVVVNVYPNPTTNFVNVNAAEAIREVRIINAIGQVVYTNSNVNADALQVNTQNFAAGTYMVTVKTDNGMATSRLNVVR